MTITSTLRRTAAGGAVAALAASALMFAPAQADSTVTVRNSDVLTSESSATYSSWHQGYPDATTRAKVTQSGLELSGGPSQVIKGYADNNDQGITGIKNFNINDKITGSVFAASKGAASLQIPLFVSDAGTVKFATLRSATDEGSRIKKSDLWQTSKAFGGLNANQDYPLSAIIEALGSNYKVIGFGVQASSDATITSITWDGVKYVFQEPKTTSKIEIYRVHPAAGKITTKSKVYVYARLTIDGKPAPQGTLVNVYAKAKKVTNGRLNSKGAVKVQLPHKLKKGSATLKVVFPGNDTIDTATDSVKVKVK